MILADSNTTTRRGYNNQQIAHPLSLNELKVVNPIVAKPVMIAILNTFYNNDYYVKPFRII